MIHVAFGSWWWSKNGRSAWSTASDDWYLRLRLRLELLDPALDLRLGLGIVCFAARRVFCATCWAGHSASRGTMYGASAAFRVFSRSASRADSRIGLDPRRPWRDCARASSSVSGMNAFVHASTAAVSVSMKFSSSGKGVPSP